MQELSNEDDYSSSDESNYYSDELAMIEDDSGYYTESSLI
jgi:hypothetical protein